MEVMKKNQLVALINPDADKDYGTIGRVISDSGVVRVKWSRAVTKRFSLSQKSKSAWPHLRRQLQLLSEGTRLRDDDGGEGTLECTRVTQTTEHDRVVFVKMDGESQVNAIPFSDLAYCRVMLFEHHGYLIWNVRRKKFGWLNSHRDKHVRVFYEKDNVVTHDASEIRRVEPGDRLQRQSGVIGKVTDLLGPLLGPVFSVDSPVVVACWDDLPRPERRSIKTLKYVLHLGAAEEPKCAVQGARGDKTTDALRRVLESHANPWAAIAAADACQQAYDSGADVCLELARAMSDPRWWGWTCDRARAFLKLPLLADGKIDDYTMDALRYYTGVDKSFSNEDGELWDAVRRQALTRSPRRSAKNAARAVQGGKEACRRLLKAWRQPLVWGWTVQPARRALGLPDFYKLEEVKSAAARLEDKPPSLEEPLKTAAKSLTNFKDAVLRTQQFKSGQRVRAVRDLGVTGTFPRRGTEGTVTHVFKDSISVVFDHVGPWLCGFGSVVTCKEDVMARTLAETSDERLQLTYREIADEMRSRARRRRGRRAATAAWYALRVPFYPLKLAWRRKRLLVGLLAFWAVTYYGDLAPHRTLWGAYTLVRDGVEWVGEQVVRGGEAVGREIERKIEE